MIHTLYGLRLSQKNLFEHFAFVLCILSLLIVTLTAMKQSSILVLVPCIVTDNCSVLLSIPFNLQIITPARKRAG